jgi:hypothetical protein
MRFAVESWSPDYGAPMGDEALVESTAEVNAWVEADADAWAPRGVPSGTTTLDDLLFVDGVRRVEAHVWITDDDDVVHQGICASYAAGGVHCNGTARVVQPQVRHGLFSPVPDVPPISTRHVHFTAHVAVSDEQDLSLLLQTKMGELESQVAAAVGEVGLIVVDGPLKFGQAHPGKIGYIKTHSSAYGPPIVRETVTRLAVGERTPILLLGGRENRYSWYFRLPCPVRHGWAGVVRLETTADQPFADVVSLADRLSVTLPRFASCEEKDPRAPQNLYPIGGLERELRRRLGDPMLIMRSLREAAAKT